MATAFGAGTTDCCCTNGFDSLALLGVDVLQRRHHLLLLLLLLLDVGEDLFDELAADLLLPYDGGRRGRSSRRGAAAAR
ncbi:hypothetical protein [Streptomyces sp. NPDC000229]|uniref:hypothetical protein n=1 Tax=Streptomyces sp. NPDC000229 TaxID=3154247 RepID=UPI003328245E